MGFTSNDTGDKFAKEDNHPDFGQRLGQMAQSRYPVAGGLLDMVFNNQQTQAEAPQMAPMPTGASEHEDMLGMNAMLKKSQSGGLSTLLKLLA